MNLFRREQKPEPSAPAPLSELELAEHAVEEANAHIAEVGHEWKALQDSYRVTIDHEGRLATAILPPNITRDAVEHLVRLNLAERGEALAAFHRALSRYAGLKSGN